MLPLALSMAGRVAITESSKCTFGQRVHKRLRDHKTTFLKKNLQEEKLTLFSVISATNDLLSTDEEDRFFLLAVMAPGVPATQDMLANLWGTVREFAFSRVDRVLIND